MVSQVCKGEEETKCFLELFEYFLVDDFEMLDVADCKKVHANVEGGREMRSFDKGENN